MGVYEALERANILALLYVMFSCVFVTFICGVLGQVWYLIVSIPYLCLLPTLTKFRALDPLDVSAWVFLEAFMHMRYIPKFRALMTHLSFITIIPVLSGHSKIDKTKV